MLGPSNDAVYEFGYQVWGMNIDWLNHFCCAEFRNFGFNYGKLWIWANLPLQVDIWGLKFIFLPFEWIGMNAMLVYVMAAAGIFAGFINGWYYDDPHNTLVSSNTFISTLYSLSYGNITIGWEMEGLKIYFTVHSSGCSSKMPYEDLYWGLQNEHWVHSRGPI